MKATDELLHQIKEQKVQDISFLKEKEYSCPPIHLYLQTLLMERGFRVRDVIWQLNVDRTYGYQMFNGIRKPTRVFLIRLAVLLGLSVEETNRLLKIGRKEILYPRIREDAAAIFAIEKSMRLEQLDELWERLE